MTSPIRQETISIRGIVPGEYTVNVHYYLATKGGPVPVAVKVEKINPAGRGRLLRYAQRSIAWAQEKTAVRFKVAEGGDVIDVSHRDKSLIQLTRSVRRSNATK